MHITTSTALQALSAATATDDMESVIVAETAVLQAPIRNYDDALAVLAISGSYIHRDDQAVLERHNAAVALLADKLGVDLAGLADWYGVG